ncbi:hypothetical protein MT418_002020 [Batrachochytrium dendrobatidis]
MLALAKQFQDAMSHHSSTHSPSKVAFQTKTTSSSKRIIKQGWILKKSGSSLFAKWRQKYLVLSLDTSRTDVKNQDARYVLHLYDDRDISKLPKHEIEVADLRIDPTGNGSGVGSSTSSRLKRYTAPFVLYSNKRKFYLAAQIQTDRDEWLDLLQQQSNKNNGGKLLHRNSESHNREPTYGISRSGTVQSMRTPRARAATLSRYVTQNNTAGPASISRSNSRYSYSGSLYRDESDARSVYSNTESEYFDDDAVSVVSGVSGVTRTTITPSQRNSPDEDDCSYTSSRVETLSFNSEPVLTPYELTVMGDPLTAKNKINSAHPMPVHNKDTLRKRRAPMQLMSSTMAYSQKSWNEKYQALLSMRAITPEALLSRDVQIMDLIGNFREISGDYAQKIIDGLHLQNGLSNLTNTPMEHGGIIFQFACNYDTSNPDEVHIALSRSSRELKGIDAALQASCRAGDGNIPVLRTILMALIDYKGFRIIAHADIGGLNQVQVVHDLHPEHPILDDTATNCMALIGRELNLKQHAVQVNVDRRVQVPLSATSEVHMDSKSKVMYLTSLHEIFPIDHYVEDGQSRAAELSQGVKTMSLCHKDLLENGDSNMSINLNHRLRPEFLTVYQTNLCADGLTPTSGSSRREMEDNDAQVSRASRFLRETWIPGFVRTLDSLDARPFDSASMTGEMHRNGVNMRYLGMVCSLSTIPFIRNLALIEMVARIVKSILRDRIRSAILHFKTVGATQIDEQMRSYVTSMFSSVLGNSEKSQRYFEDKICSALKSKFSYQIGYRQFNNLHRPALFFAMQYHCGVQFSDSMDYNFECSTPILPSNFKSFTVSVKTLSGLAQIQSVPNSRSATTTQIMTGMQGNSSVSSVSSTGYDYNGGEHSGSNGNSGNPKEEERLAYLLARHFKSVGPKAKLSPCNASATALSQIASYYNSIGRFEEARMYAQAAVSSSLANHIIYALASAQLLFALAGLQTNAMEAPDTTILATYRNALNVAEWHWGSESPLVLCLHDHMSAIYQRSQNPQKALEYIRQSLDISKKSLGKNHVYTAAYLTKTACFLKLQSQIDEAIDRLTQAIHIYQSLRSDPAKIAEVHFYMAECLADRGDIDGAIQHAQTCRRLRERMFGFSDIRVIESCQQVATMVLAPYVDYKGVLTPQIRQAYRDVIGCHEKVFRYLKTVSQKQPMSGHFYGGRYSSSVSNHGDSSGLSMIATIPISKGTIKRNQVFNRQQMVSGAMMHTGGAIDGRMMASEGSNGYATSIASNGNSNPLLSQGSSAQLKNVYPAASKMVSRACNLLGTSGSSYPISGPLITSPYGWTSPLSRSLMHKLTKDIVKLKLALLESPRHRECVRMLRAQRLAASSGTSNVANNYSNQSYLNQEGTESLNSGIDPEEARGVILRLAAVSPSVYLDGILQRIDDGDHSAVEELRVVLMLTESETVGLVA